MENIEEAKLIQSIETNDKLEKIGKDTEASLLLQSEGNDALKELSQVVEATIINDDENTDKIVQSVKELSDKLEPKEIGDGAVFTVKGLKGDKGDKPTEEELLVLIKPLIPEPIKGDDGEDYILTEQDKKDIVSSIEVPIIEKIIEKTETIIEKPITIDKTVTIDKTKTVVKEVAKYETAEDIVAKLNTLSKALDWKTIKNFPDFSKNGGSGLNTVFTDGTTIVGNGLADNPLRAVGSSSITGLITAGTNVTITGNGTATSPYVINSTGGGGGIGGSIASTQIAIGSGTDTIAGSGDFTKVNGVVSLFAGAIGSPAWINYSDTSANASSLGWFAGQNKSSTNNFQVYSNQRASTVLDFDSTNDIYKIGRSSAKVRTDGVNNVTIGDTDSLDDSTRLIVTIGSQIESYTTLFNFKDLSGNIWGEFNTSGQAVNFGDLSNAINGTKFSVDVSASGITNFSNLFYLRDVAGTPLLEADMFNKTFSFGDLTNVVSNTKFILNANTSLTQLLSNTFTVADPSAGTLYTKIDAPNLSFFFGDGDQSSSGSTNIGSIVFQPAQWDIYGTVANGSSLTSVIRNDSNGVVWIGDSDGAVNGTYFSVDDVNTTFNFSTRNITIGAQAYLFPASSGAGVLTNDGVGNLTWTAAGSGTVTNVSVVTANGISGSVATSTTTPAITLTLGAITPTSVVASGTVTGSNLSGTNTGNVTISGENYLSLAGQVITVNAVNLSGTNVTGTLAAARFGALTGDVTNTAGSYATTVGKINGTSLAGLATGLLKNTTGTGVPSIAVSGTDYVAPGAITTDGITMSTNKILGRTTASTGAVEEITVGSGLTLSAGTLSASGGGSVTITEAEIDFGSIPVPSKKFTITNAGISATSKIMVTPSGSVATGRVGDDWEWDAINFSAKSGTGQFVLTAKTTYGKIIGKRKIYYTYA
jgi:hypothetical protein